MSTGIGAIQGTPPVAAPPEPVAGRRGVPGTGFDALLDSLGRTPPKSGETAPGGDIVFSRHATARMRSRGIELDEADVAAMGQAIDRLAERNARESLVLMGDHAFIVGVPKRTVITAMTRQEAIGSVFTNIDSTLVLR